MALLPGTRLGPYEVVAPLGAGGMGEVYRARDTRLERPVAIKILPLHLTDRLEARERSNAKRTPSRLSITLTFANFTSRRAEWSQLSGNGDARRRDPGFWLFRPTLDRSPR